MIYNIPGLHNFYEHLPIYQVVATSLLLRNANKY